MTPEDRAALREAARMEGMEEAAKIVDEKAYNIRRSNTYRGKTNSHGAWAADMVDAAAAAIRARAAGGGAA